MKRITQETFDETVRENMEEFDMCREEAVKDAIKQIQSQGVDLSNICISVDECDDHWLLEVTGHLDVLTQAIGDGKGTLQYEKSPCLQAIQSLLAVCTGCAADKVSNAKKVLASKEATNVLARFCAAEDKEVAIAAYRALEALCDGHEDNRDSFWPLSMSHVCQDAQRRRDDPEYIKALMGSVRALCTKTENNKVSFVSNGGLDLLISSLKAFHEEPSVVLATCLAAKAVTAVDDFRKDFSSAHNHTRQLMGKGAVSLFLGVAKAYRTDTEIMAAALAAVKNLALNEESVGQIASQGGIELVTTALEAHLENPVLCRTAISVMRNLSADDKLKKTLCTSGGAELMLKAMRKHSQEPRLMEHGLATIGAMALRYPENALRLIGMGAGLVVLQSMQMHKSVGSLQRQGCLAIRNLVSRNAELVDSFLEAGAEPLLRHAGSFQESVDEAYAALRDLKCEVKRLVVDPTTGKATEAVEQFGSVKTNFRPVFDASNEIDQSIEQAITEPSQAYRF